MINQILIIGFCLLGVWKLYDLLFPKLNKKDITFTTTVSYITLMRFFAEYLYKQEAGLESYTKAPLEMYKRLSLAFQDWLKLNKQE